MSGKYSEGDDVIRLLGFLIGSAASLGVILLVLGVPEINLSEQVVEAENLEAVTHIVEEIATDLEAIASEVMDEISDEPRAGETENVLEFVDGQPPAETDIVELPANDPELTASGSVSVQNPIQRGTRLQDWLDDCIALQVRTKQDAVVFFLNHQVNHGLVRLSGPDCSYRTEARIARANEPVEYALPLLTLTRDASSPSGEWPIDPDADIYYAIAVSDSKAARALSRQLERLPRRCSLSVYPGLEGVHLENWMNEFSAAVDRDQPHVDWQAIRVRNVF